MGNIILCPIKALTNFGAGHAIIIHRYHNNGLVISPSLLFENPSFAQMVNDSINCASDILCNLSKRRAFFPHANYIRFIALRQLNYKKLFSHTLNLWSQRYKHIQEGSLPIRSAYSFPSVT